MQYKFFARARRFGRRAIGVPIGVYIAGIAAAVALAMLLVLMALLVELLANRGALDTVMTDTWLSTASSHWSASHGAETTGHGLLALFGAAVALSLIAAGMLYWLEWSLQSSAVRLASALRKQIYVQAHQLGAFDLFGGRKMTSSNLLQQSTDIVRRAQVAWWRVVPHAAAFALFMLALAVSIDFWLTMSTILLAGLGWWLVVMLRERARRRAALAADRSQHFNEMLLEHLAQNRLLGNLTSEARTQAHSFDENLRHYDAALLARETTTSGVGPLVTLLLLIGASLVLLLAGYNVLQSRPRLSLADVVLLVSALGALAYPLIRCERLLALLPSADTAAEEIFGYLDREPLVGQLPQAVPLERLVREVKLENVTLLDGWGKKLLEDVSCMLPAGSQTVLFSSDEATPLALAGLLARFCDPASGRILFDGREIKAATLDSVRHQVALILPENLLFSGTLAENLVGDDTHFSFDEQIEALKSVHAYDFIQALPEGLKTMIGPHGLMLSAGQAIRLGLARVLLRKPSIVVIEEPMEDLDQATAEKVGDALDRAAKGCTLVFLARRLAALRAAPRILVFHEGRLIADGTHPELLQQNDLYRHLNYVRFNEFRGKVR
jgi:ATP-binding cassette, subfamily B, bacterial